MAAGIILYLKIQNNMAKELSQTFLIAAKSMRAALTILKKNGGSMPSGQLMDLVGNEVEFSDWEKETTSRGGIRWQNVYHFSSVDYVLAGFLIKKNGIWYLTPEGEKALSMPPEEMPIAGAKTEVPSVRAWGMAMPFS